jgi:hypothetical protein
MARMSKCIYLHFHDILCLVVLNALEHFHLTSSSLRRETFQAGGGWSYHLYSTHSRVLKVVLVFMEDPNYEKAAK